MAVLSRSIGDDIVEIHAPQVDITRRVWIKYTFYCALRTGAMVFCFCLLQKIGEISGGPFFHYCPVTILQPRRSDRRNGIIQMDLLSGPLACRYHCSDCMWSNFAAGSTVHANGELLKFTSAAATTYLLMRATELKSSNGMLLAPLFIHNQSLLSAGNNVNVCRWFINHCIARGMLARTHQTFSPATLPRPLHQHPPYSHDNFVVRPEKSMTLLASQLDIYKD